MKIALTIDQLDPRKGGAERYAHALAECLLDRGHELHIFSRRFEPRIEGAVWHSISVGSRRGAREWQFATTVESRLKREAHDVVLGLGRVFGADVLMPHGGVHAAWLERDLLSMSPLRRAVTAWNRRAISLHQRNAFRIEKIQYQDPALRAVIAVSRLVEEDLLRHHPVEPEKVAVILNGIDLEKYHPGLRTSLGAEARSLWGLGDSPVVLFVANNFRLKGLGAALRVLATIGRELGAWWGTALVVGNGGQAPYRFEARRLGCLERIRFVGPVERMELAYAAADVLLQPTYYDPCSLTTLEALACGIPVVTTRRNGASEVIHSSAAGFTADAPEQIDMLASETARFLRTTDGGKEATARAARNCVEKLSMQDNFAAVLSVLERAAEERGRRPARGLAVR